MSSLSTVEASLPPGFRFHPRDEELICDYLMRWVMGSCTTAQQSPFLIEVDLNKVEPWDIPEIACVGGKEWYFYSQRDRKYATGVRTNRATISGYWKATGKDRPISRKGTLVGMRKTLVFYQGRAPKGKKTEWVMHEFRLEGALIGHNPKISSYVKEDWVLCRVFHKKSQPEPSASKQEIITCSSPSLPQLVEPHNIITFDHNANASNCHQQQQQVPCFSNSTILSPPQTNPTFSHIRPPSKPNHHHHHHPSSVMPILPPAADVGNVVNNYPPPYDQGEKDVIKAVINHLTKMENNPISAANDQCINPPFVVAADHGMILKDSPSFGEGSSDSYLSEVGFSSLWNNYS